MVQTLDVLTAEAHPLAGSPHSSVDASEEQYVARLDSAIGTALATPNSPSLTALIAQCHGAYPTKIVQRLRELGLMYRLGPDKNTLEPRFYDVELHPLNFEWYFTTASARELASLASSQGGHVNCLGTPTVALELLDRGIAASLIDGNPLVMRRFREFRSLENVAIDDVAGASGAVPPSSRPPRQYDRSHRHSAWQDAATQERTVKIGH